MLTGLDHIIIGVNNLKEASAIFAENLGLLPSGGGRHPNVGTENRIIVVGDTYIELIAIYEPEDAEQGIRDRLAKGDGYLNYALASNNIEADSAAMRERGIQVLGPTHGQLDSSDGRSRAWSRLNVERPVMRQRYPFIIQHDSAGAERRFRLAGWTEPPAHPLGAAKVLSATIAVENLAEATPRFQNVYGLQPSEPFTGDVDDWEAMLTAFMLSQSQQSLELAEPLPLANCENSSSTGLPETELVPEETGSLARYLQAYGESLCRITLGVTDMAQARRYLDTHGVTYSYKESSHPGLWIHPSSACGAAIVLHELTL